MVLDWAFRETVTRRYFVVSGTISSRVIIMTAATYSSFALAPEIRMETAWTMIGSWPISAICLAMARGILMEMVRLICRSFEQGLIQPTPAQCCAQLPSLH